MKHTLTLLATLLLSPLAASAAPDKPNVVFILADDLGVNDLAIYGSKFFETPNIDALARRGMKFNQAYSASPLCSPTRSSILTGLYPARTGITAPECHLPKEVLDKHLAASAPPAQKALAAESVTRLTTNYYTLAEAFKADGYATAHFGKWHLGPEPYSPLQQGFDVDVPHTPAPSPLGKGFFYPFPVWKNHGKPGDNLEDLLADEAVKFIEQHKHQPFFLNYWAFEVHSPWQAKDKQIDKYRAKADPASLQRNPVYAGMVETLDEVVGRLVAALDKAGVLERTVIVFTSDNGPYFIPNQEHMPAEFHKVPVTSAQPLRAGKGTIYEAGTRVPLVVVWPGCVPPGAETSALMQSTDFFPTFADLLGWKLPAAVRFDGVSLRPALERNAPVRDEIFCHFPHSQARGEYERMPAQPIRPENQKETGATRGKAATSQPAAESRPNGIAFDLQGFIDQKIQAGEKRIVVPPGRYRVTPRKRQHLVLQGLKDLQIIADGVEMICTETTRALTIADCTNVTVRGLVIDYDPLPFTRGRITGLSPDKKTHEIELFKGYPEADEVRNYHYEIFRPDTRTLRCETYFGVERVEVIDSLHLRVVKPRGSAQDLEQVGDLIVIGTEHAPGGSIPHAILCGNNVNVRLENIDLFASNCFGFLENDCDGSVYYRCRIDRRDPASDPVPRTDPRLRSLNADAFHSKHAIKGPAYLECSARFQFDDCINICGDYHMIMAGQGRELRVLAKHAMNIQAGDPVELVTYQGDRLPDAKAVAVQPAGAIRDEERAFLGQQRMDKNLRTARGGALEDAFTITLDREVSLPMGSLICSASRIGNGFTVKDCNFGFNRSRGILIKASHGEISGNRIEGTWMSAILVSPSYWWLEAGSSSDLIITGNTIIDSRGIPILVEAAGGSGDVAPAGAHSNITITDNTIRDCPTPGILVTSTRGLRIENNAQAPSGMPPQVHASLRKTGLKEIKPVMKLNCAP